MLENIITKSKNLIKKGANYTKSFLATSLIVGTMITSALTPQQTFAQNNGNKGRKGIVYDTIWGKGLFQTINAENGNFISYGNLYLTPDTMQIITPDTTYLFETNHNALASFELPTGIDIHDGIQEYKTENTNSTIFPTPGAGFNYNTTKNNKGTITTYNTNGQKIKTTNINGKHTFVDLNDQSNGLYTYTITTQDQTTSGKFIKINSPKIESTTIPNKNKEKTNNFKDAELRNATYKVKWEREGYYTDSTYITIHDGNNGFINFYLTPLPSGTITYIDTVRSHETEEPLEGIVARILIADTVFTTDTSDANGVFILENIPQNTPLNFEIGENPDSANHQFWAFANVTGYTTPDTTQLNTTDTIYSLFNTYLITKDPNTTAEHMRQQNRLSKIQDTVLYAYKKEGYGEITDQEEAIYDNWLAQLQDKENNVHIYVKTDWPLNFQTGGISISDGVYNTESYPESYTNYFGSFYPIRYANTTTNTGSKICFWHEIGRAVGKKEVSWYSVMRGDAPDYVTEDSVIITKSKPYWNRVYSNQTGINLLKIFEDLPARNTKNTIKNINF